MTRWRVTYRTRNALRELVAEYVVHLVSERDRLAEEGLTLGYSVDVEVA